MFTTPRDSVFVLPGDSSLLSRVTRPRSPDDTFLPFLTSGHKKMMATSGA